MQNLSSLTLKTKELWKGGGKHLPPGLSSRTKSPGFIVLRKYDNFKLSDDGELTYIYKRTVIDLGNINERLKAPWEIRKLGVAKLRSMGFTNITDQDVQPHRARYIKARKKVRILNEDLNERLKAIYSRCRGY